MTTEKNLSVNPSHTNPDPITGAPASHPGATAVGSASGAATGAALGALGGPIGAIIGGVAGAAVGGGVGHAAGESHDPSAATDPDAVVTPVVPRTTTTRAV
jgi:phage tail tape-measure protein